MLITDATYNDGFMYIMSRPNNEFDYYLLYVALKYLLPNTFDQEDGPAFPQVTMHAKVNSWILCDSKCLYLMNLSSSAWAVLDIQGFHSVIDGWRGYSVQRTLVFSRVFNERLFRERWLYGSSQGYLSNGHAPDLLLFTIKTVVIIMVSSKSHIPAGILIQPCTEWSFKSA